MKIKFITTLFNKIVEQREAERARLQRAKENIETYEFKYGNNRVRFDNYQEGKRYLEKIRRQAIQNNEHITVSVQKILK